MPTIHIPTPLRTYTEGQASVAVDAGTIATNLEQLVTTYPGLRTNLFDKDGNLRAFVNLYFNDEDLRYLPGKQQTETKDSDELTIIPSIAGGRA